MFMYIYICVFKTTISLDIPPYSSDPNPINPLAQCPGLEQC